MAFLNGQNLSHGPWYKTLVLVEFNCSAKRHALHRARAYDHTHSVRDGSAVGAEHGSRSAVLSGGLSTALLHGTARKRMQNEHKHRNDSNNILAQQTMTKRLLARATATANYNLRSNKRNHAQQPSGAGGARTSPCAQRTEKQQSQHATQRRGHHHLLHHDMERSVSWLSAIRTNDTTPARTS